MRFQCPDREDSKSNESRGRYEPRSTQNSKRVNAAEIDNNGALYSRFKIQGIERACLIDSGSEVSIIPLKWSEGLEIMSSQGNLRAVNGTRITLYGEVEAGIEVGYRTVSTSLLVTDQIDTVILGLDWLTVNSCRIDFSSNEMQIGDICVQLYRLTRTDRCRRILMSETVKIPPRSEVNVESKMVYHDMRFDEGTWVTENRNSLHPGIHVAQTLIEASNERPVVRVMNISNSPVELKGGDDLCTASLVSDIVEVSLMTEAVPVETKSEHEQVINELVSGVYPGIPTEYKERLRLLLLKHVNAISLHENDMGRTKVVKHHIDTGSALPIRQPLRRIPQSQAKAVDDQLEEMIKQKLIKPSQSSFASNVVLVKKKDNTYRFCVDYRRVNDISVKDAYPLPRIDECLDTMTGSAWFSTIDLRSGYFQVELAEEDAHKTAFITRRGLFEFQVMPQGMCNSAATFHRLMNLILAGLSYEACLVYIDDIVIYLNTRDVHLERLEVVLERLDRAGLKIRPDKCKLIQTEVLLLGHVISAEGIKTSPEKTDVVATWPVPRTVKETRSFLGLCSYYRRFVQDFAKTAKPLHALTGKYARFQWTEECQKAFEELKQKTITAPVIAFPRDEDTFILDCDASNEAIGAVLSQIQDGHERVIAYASRLYSKAEANYCVTRKELLAVVHFCKYFRQYLLGRDFIIRTDHSALSWLRKMSEPIGQQSRWLEILEEFTFTVQHRSGNKHGNADAMSRRPCRQCHRMDGDDTVISPQENVMSNNVGDDSVIKQQVNAVSNGDDIPTEMDPWNPERLAKRQQEDIQLQEFYNLKLKYPDGKPVWEEVIPTGEVTKILWSQWDNITMQDQVLYRNTLRIHEQDVSTKQVIVPRVLRKQLMKMAHEGMTGGHLGFEKTKVQVQRRAYWPGFSKDVLSFCQACEPCARYRRGAAPKQGLMEPLVTGDVMERVSIDITGPHPTSSLGYKYMLTIVDHFSKWADAFPIRNQEAQTVAKVLLDRVFCYLGMPLQILSDQGANFQSELFRELCISLDIEKIRTSIYKPSTNGAVERFHRTLNSMIGRVVAENHRNWHELIPQIMAAYRASEHSATGFSPNKIMLGRECRAPIDLVLGTPGDPDAVFSHDKYVQNKQEQMIFCYAAVREHLGESARRRKHTYDMTVKPKRFQIGQKVWYYYPRRYKSRSPKWQRFYTGPFEIVKQLGPLNYLLKKCNGRKEILAHVDKMKICREVESQGVNDSSLNNNNVEIHPETGVNDSSLDYNNVNIHSETGVDDSSLGFTTNVRPRRTTKKPARFNEYVCSISMFGSHQRKKSRPPVRLQRLLRRDPAYIAVELWAVGLCFDGMSSWNIGIS